MIDGGKGDETATGAQERIGWMPESEEDSVHQVGDWHADRWETLRAGALSLRKAPQAGCRIEAPEGDNEKRNVVVSFGYLNTECQRRCDGSCSDSCEA